MASHSFNEARALCAGNLPERRGLSGRDRGFNEARALCAGNYAIIALAESGDWASMRPALYARETDPGPRVDILPAPASMRPALYARETARTSPARRSTKRASMRPALYARETAKAQQRVSLLEVASMRPALYARETRMQSVVRIAQVLLQ